MNFDDLFVLSQHLVPQHTVTRAAGLLAKSEIPAVKNLIISRFIQQYGVNMAEAARENAEDYDSFNDFFTRELKPDARIIDNSPNSLVSPVDGAFSQIGDIEQGKIFQAKGHSFSLADLLGGTRTDTRPFQDGKFTTIYLSPKDYHRIHMPITGTLREMIYIPGKLYSVNPITTQNVPNLFARNERVVTLFDTDIGPMALVLVGAMIVASVATVWAGTIAPGNQISHKRYEGREAVTLQKGEEMGRFLLGSTVVLAFGKGRINWETKIRPEQEVRLGEKIGSLL
ncbi:MAG: phosphatidylserine decarboxylase [Gammaproteobacteria bacterium]|nr:MAG: phosphatidylserine decarboxylase [Pseudomonadota bacterium]PIE38833.1 MAG: phosphatidylserine decarboxylase [Gammaproteobacteria bacterium]